MKRVNGKIIVLVVVITMFMNTNSVYAASMDDVPRIFWGWSIDSDLRTNQAITSHTGASYKNSTKKYYYHTSVKDSFTTSRAITGSLSATISGDISAKGKAVEGTLGAEVTAQIGVSIESSRTSEITMYPTSAKKGKNYIDPKTKWSTTVIAYGRVLSGYAKNFKCYACVKKGSFNIKMPTGYRNTYKYKAVK